MRNKKLFPWMILLLTSVFLLSTIILKAQNAGTFKDPRDGETYTTIIIENPLMGTKVTWMSQNLRYRISDSWAYNDDERYVKQIGRLYTLNAAKRACPSGWRLPDNSDWQTLINEFGGDNKASESLKSTRGWDNDGSGTNSSGFNALPGGSRSMPFTGEYAMLGERAFWWSSTEYSEIEAYYRWLGNDYKNVGIGYSTGKHFAFSVRCVKD